MWPIHSHEDAAQVDAEGRKTSARARSRARACMRSFAIDCGVGPLHGRPHVCISCALRVGRYRVVRVAGVEHASVGWNCSIERNNDHGAQYLRPIYRYGLCIDMAYQYSCGLCSHGTARPSGTTITERLRYGRYYLRCDTHAREAQEFAFFRKSTKRCGIFFFEVIAFQRYAVCLVWTMSH